MAGTWETMPDNSDNGRLTALEKQWNRVFDADKYTHDMASIALCHEDEPHTKHVGITGKQAYELIIRATTSALLKKGEGEHKEVNSVWPCVTPWHQ